MGPDVISLPISTSSEYLEALAEVSDFGRTDMGYPGQGPWTYCILTKASLNEKITDMSGAKSYPFGVDAVSLQPCLSYACRSQDRYFTEEWDLPNGKWIFNAVLDGHLNHDTVDYIVQQLPRVVKDALRASAPAMGPEYISEMLRSAIQQVDDRLTSRVLNLLPENMRGKDRVNSDHTLSEFPDADLQLIAQSLGGATIVLSLTDSKGNLWVANLGDCRAVLAYRHDQGWSGTQVTSVHDLNNPEELIRITQEHPGEANAIKDNRVIGFLEPTRGLGDTWLKIPASYISCIYKNVKQPWISPKQLENYSSRILTPPYVSNTPDIYHFTPQIPYFLLLGSDGLLSTERYNGMNATQIIDYWVNILGSAIDTGTETNVNAALYLLQDILGGDDIGMVSRNLTVEMEERWMDDITVLIQTVRTHSNILNP
ncbi:hypothetical protein C0995_015978 [Termitomyces sp. Mi166|nr:hypothetical protein C0995_015978 [Termitomyces sp. Mi166\